MTLNRKDLEFSKNKMKKKQKIPKKAYKRNISFNFRFLRNFSNFSRTNLNYI